MSPTASFDRSQSRVCADGALAGDARRARTHGVGQVESSGRVARSSKRMRRGIDQCRAMRGKPALAIADRRTCVDDRPIHEVEKLRVGPFRSMESV